MAAASALEFDGHVDLFHGVTVNLYVYLVNRKNTWGVLGQSPPFVLCCVRCPSLRRAGDLTGVAGGRSGRRESTDPPLGSGCYIAEPGEGGGVDLPGI